MRSVKQPGPFMRLRGPECRSTRGRSQSPGFGGQNLALGGRQSGTAADALLGLHSFVAWSPVIQRVTHRDGTVTWRGYTMQGAVVMRHRNRQPFREKHSRRE